MESNGELRNQLGALWNAMNAMRCFKEDGIPCQIEEGLFLGSIGAAYNLTELKKLNVTHILTVTGSLQPCYPHDFTYKLIKVADREDTNLVQYFDECFDFIDEARRSGGGVLVHCFVGRSRSVTVTLAYLMKKHGMSLSQATEHVKRVRPQASPNSGFISQLRNFETTLQRNTAETNC